MIEKKVFIETRQARLSATLCLPEKDGVFTTVLMIHGSGKLDRDSNARRFKLNLFNTFAHKLAEIGIASLRYDKRGIGKSSGSYFKAGHFDLVSDARACLDYLAQNSHCDTRALYLLGHSEGSIIAPQVAQESLNIAGIILLTPFIQAIEPMLVMQAEGIKQSSLQLTGIKGRFIRLIFRGLDPVKMQSRFIHRLKHSQKDYLSIMHRKIPVKWLQELLSISPEDIYRTTNCPCLIIGGSKDVQCRPDDVASIAAILPGKTESHVIKDMSHLLRHEPNNATMFNYKNQLSLPIEPDVMKLISRWIVARSDASS